jgi:hypothetical protein
MKHIALLLSACLFFSTSYGKVPPSVKNIVMIDYLPKMADLHKEFGNYKAIPEEFKLQILIALSYFPELKNKVIDFKYQNIGTTMACRPDLISVLRGRSSRFYNVFIDNDKTDTGNILLKDLPFNAQVGVIAHELCHILDYEQMNTSELAKMGIDYEIKKKRADVERRVDKLTIRRGLGWQLWDWADFVLNRSKATLEYKYYKKKTYLSPEEIKKEIENDKEYQTSTSKGFWRNDFMIEIWGVCLGLCVSFVFQSDFRKLILNKLSNV